MKFWLAVCILSADVVNLLLKPVVIGALYSDSRSDWSIYWVIQHSVIFDEHYVTVICCKCLISKEWWINSIEACWHIYAIEFLVNGSAGNNIIAWCRIHWPEQHSENFLNTKRGCFATCLQNVILFTFHSVEFNKVTGKICAFPRNVSVMLGCRSHTLPVSYSRQEPLENVMTPGG